MLFTHATAQFRIRFDALKRSFETANAAFDAQIAAADSDWAALQAKVATAEATLEHYDADGNLAYDAGEAAGERRDDIEAARKHVLNAYTIALAHFWERQAREALGLTGATRWIDKAKALGAQGHDWGIDWSALENLRLAANVHKHDAGDSAAKLWKRRPEWLPPTRTPTWRPVGARH